MKIAYAGIFFSSLGSTHPVRFTSSTAQAVAKLDFLASVNRCRSIARPCDCGRALVELGKSPGRLIWRHRTSSKPGIVRPDASARRLRAIPEHSRQWFQSRVHCAALRSPGPNEAHYGSSHPAHLGVGGMGAFELGIAF